MKKVLALVLTVAMVLAMAACGNSEESTQNKDTGSGTQAAADTVEDASSAAVDTEDEANDEDEAEIVVAFYCNVAPSDTERIEEAINAITIPAINTSVKLNPVSVGAYNEQINLMISSNEQLDLMPTFFFGTTAFASMMSQKQLLPLNDLLDEYGQDILSVMKADYLETTTYDGNIYAVPVNKDMVSNTYYAMRTDILEQVGMLETAQNCSSMDDIEKILAAVKEQTDLVPLAPAGSSGVLNFSPVLLTRGVNFDECRTYDKLLNDYIVSFTDDPNTVTCLYDSEEYQQACQLIEDWYNAGYIYSDAANADENNYMYVSSGKAFSYFFAAENSTYMDTVAQSGYEMTVVRVSSAPVSTSTVNTLNWVIPVTAREEEAAMKFMNLMYSNGEILDLLNYGQEGVDYVVGDDGVYKFAEGKDMNNSGWFVNLSWEFGNQYLTGLWDGADPNTREISRKDNENPVLSPLLGFTSNSEGLENQITAVSNVYNEYTRGLNCGVLDVETVVPEFRTKLASAGMADIVAQVQQQLDEWLAEQE